MFPLNTFENLCVFFLLLMIYSAAGWVGEMFYCSVGKGHICEKRGFLNGFICPIYGHGALLVLYVLHGGLKNPLLTFLAGMALTSALEYFTSWFMEAVFHMRWWDYSRKKIQLNGRICLQNSLLFGLACVLLCHVVNPPVMAWLFHIGSAYTIPVASFLFGLYLMDKTSSPSAAPSSCPTVWTICRRCGRRSAPIWRRRPPSCSRSMKAVWRRSPTASWPA